MHRLLCAKGFECETYPSGSDFLGRAKLDRGVILLDLTLADLDGFAVLEELGRRNCPLAVIIVSGHGNISAAVEAMKLGATDFLEKPCDDVRLITAIERALAISKSSADELVGQAAATGKVDSLTPRQRQILLGMVAGQSNKMMARDLGLSPRTVETHRSHMLERLGASNASDAIRLANQARLGPTVPPTDRPISPQRE